MSNKLFATSRRAKTRNEVLYQPDVKEAIDYVIKQQSSADGEDILFDIPVSLIADRRPHDDRRVPAIWSFGGFYRDTGVCLLPATPEATMLNYVIVANYFARTFHLGTSMPQVSVNLIRNMKIALGYRSGNASRILIAEVIGFTKLEGDSILSGARTDRTCLVTLRALHLQMSDWDKEWNTPLVDATYNFDWLLSRAQIQLDSAPLLHPTTINQLIPASERIRTETLTKDVLKNISFAKITTVTPKKLEAALGADVLDAMYGGEQYVSDQKVGVRVYKQAERYDECESDDPSKVEISIQFAVQKKDGDSWSTRRVVEVILSEKVYDSLEATLGHDLPTFANLIGLNNVINYKPGIPWAQFVRELVKRKARTSNLYRYVGYPLADTAKMFNM